MAARVHTQYLHIFTNFAPIHAPNANRIKTPNCSPGTRYVLRISEKLKEVPWKLRNTGTLENTKQSLFLPVSSRLCVRVFIRTYRANQMGTILDLIEWVSTNAFLINNDIWVECRLPSCRHEARKKR